MKLKKLIFPLTYGVILTAFTVYLLLNTFVLEQVYDSVTPIIPETEANDTDDTSAETDEPEVKKEPVITENSYTDDNIEITISQHRFEGSDLYVADVKLTAVEYLKTALAKDTYGKNITMPTSEIAKENNAILAVNGDFYGAQEKGYVLKNGILYRNEPHKKQEDLVIFEDGTFEFFLESEVNGIDLYKSGAYQIFAFGPSLLEDGRLTESKIAPRGAIKKNNPRTAIGWVDDLHYMFVVCDGRTEDSKGITTSELAEFMQEMGCIYAYNLDGGGSATMYFNGELVNNPTFDGKDFKERNVSDIVYVGY